MAKTQRYTENQLLDAVIRYADKCKNKIKATELAAWARENIEGMEEVRDYNFTRLVKEKNEKTGKVVGRKKLCTEKIEEINKARDLNTGISSNILLKSVNINTFFEQQKPNQRRLIMETRGQFDELMKRNISLIRENNIIRVENKQLGATVDETLELIKCIKKEQKLLGKHVKFLMQAMDEDKRRAVLREIGVDDGNFDLNKYMDSLKSSQERLLDLGAVMKSYRKMDLEDELEYIEEKNEAINKESLVNGLMNGLDFKQ